MLPDAVEDVDPEVSAVVEAAGVSVPVDTGDSMSSGMMIATFGSAEGPRIVIDGE